MKTMQFINKTTGWMTLTVAALLVPVSAYAVIVVPDQLEVVTIPNVGNTFQTVNLENTYTNAIPVCTYNLPSLASVPAVVRIRTGSITANSFDVQILNPANATTSGAVTPGDVHCFVSEVGVFSVPFNYEVLIVTSTGTNGQQLGWGSAATENITGVLTNFYASPVVLGQVITDNDPEYSTFWSHGTSQTNPPSSTNISVGKQVGNDNNGRVNEDLGVIVMNGGSTGNINGVDYAIALGADTVTGVTAPVSYGLTKTYLHGIASHSAMDGVNGGWVVLFGNSPLAGNAINLAIDEDVDRGHTNENVAYWVFDPVTVADLGVTLTDGSATYAPGSTVVYTVVVSNAGVNDSTDATLTVAKPAAVTFTTWSCAASGAAACANSNGVGNVSETSANLPVGDTLTFTINADVPSGFTGALALTATTSSATFTDNDATNDTATDTDTQSSLIDLEVSNDDGSTTYIAGNTLVYTMSVTNNGPSDASNVNVVNAEPMGTTVSGWTCVGASCPAPIGAGPISETAASLVSGDSLVYTVNVAVPVGFSASLVNIASASATETDSDNTNDSATDTNLQLIDSDNDGILDSIEIGPDPANPLDADADGVPDYLENNSADTDGDGLTNNADADDDGDGLLTIDELGAGGGLNPADSDGDGRPDYLSASKIQTGVDGGAGSMSLFIWLVVLIRVLINKIIRRHAKCSKGFYKRYC